MYVRNDSATKEIYTPELADARPLAVEHGSFALVRSFSLVVEGVAV